MCEHRITWRHCTICRTRAPIPLRQNITCENANLWKLGKCSTGLRDREIVEQIECADCQNRRAKNEDKERRRLWEKAWPGPVQPGEPPVRAEMKNAAQQTVEKWPKVVVRKERTRGDKIVVQQTHGNIVYDADDEYEDRGLVMLRKV